MRFQPFAGSMPSRQEDLVNLTNDSPIIFFDQDDAPDYHFKESNTCLALKWFIEKYSKHL